MEKKKSRPIKPFIFPFNPSLIHSLTPWILTPPTRNSINTSPLRRKIHKPPRFSAFLQTHYNPNPPLTLTWYLTPCRRHIITIRVGTAEKTANIRRHAAWRLFSGCSRGWRLNMSERKIGTSSGKGMHRWNRSTKIGWTGEKMIKLLFLYCFRVQSFFQNKMLVTLMEWPIHLF